LLWAGGLASLVATVWWYRFRGGIALTLIERQCGLIWGMLAVAVVLTGVIN
jgi:hypothetical protein